MTSTRRWCGSGRRAWPLINRARTRCWWGGPRTYSPGVRTSQTTLTRHQAYARAGADVLYAPGIRTREQIAAVVAATAPMPVNLIVGSASELTMEDIAALGVRRVGGALARSARGGFMRAVRCIADHGRFDGFADAASGADLNSLFRAP